MNLRKTLSLALALVMLFCLTAPVYAANDHAVVLKIGNPNCTLDGQVSMVDTANANVVPVAESGRTLLPIRMLIEHFGGAIDWNGATQQVTCSLNGRSVVLTLESKIALVNGEAKELDVPATAREGRTLVPVRFVSENLNLNVKWESTNNLVIVSDQPLPDDNAQLVARDDVRNLLNALNASAPPPSSSPAEETLTVGGKNYYIGMTEAQLTSLAGQPDETTYTTNVGTNCYFFGTSDYRNFFMAGVSEEKKVVSLCSAGVSFSYMGKTAGATNVSFSNTNNVYVTAMFDQNDNNILHAVLLYDKNSGGSKSSTSSGEEKINFHLTNAFRVYHGLPALKWSEEAKTSAWLHSKDMETSGYFDHISLDGRTPRDRMKAQGISGRIYGENIFTTDNIFAYSVGINAYNWWVNSGPHRENMLDIDYTYLGVGFYLRSLSFATQNFFS